MFRGLFTSHGLPGVLLGVLGLLVFLRYVTSRWQEAWGTELRVWSIAYAAYLVAVVPITSSVLRFAVLSLVPFWPFPGSVAEAEETSAARRLRWGFLLALVVVNLVLQWVWVTHVFTVTNGPQLQPFP